MGLKGCPETLTNNCHYTLCNIPEESRSQVAITQGRCSKESGMPFARDMRGKRKLSGVQERSPGRIDRHRIWYVSQQWVPRRVFARHQALQIICCVVSVTSVQHSAVLLYWLKPFLFDSPSGPRLPLLDPKFTHGRTPLDGVPDDRQHSLQQDIHASGGIRTNNPSKRTVADPRLTQFGQFTVVKLLLLFVNHQSFTV
jgi:hypothetical protein